MDVTMGLLAALLWGGTDFLVGLNARAVGVKRAVYFGQALGFLIMTLLLVIFPAFLFKSLDAPFSVWLLGIAAALLTVSGALALSKAFALGKAAIVAPLVTSYGVVTTLLSWASGEHISLVQLGCIALCVIGVVLSSIHKDNGTLHNNPRLSIAYAMFRNLVRHQFLAARPLHTAGVGADHHVVAGLPGGPVRAGGDGAEDQGWPEDPATEKLRDVDRGELDESRRVLGVFVGRDGRLGVGGDRDQYAVGRHCGDSGVRVFQGTIVSGAGGRRRAGAGRCSGTAHRRLIVRA